MVSSLQTTRTFVAIDFTEECKRQLAALQQQLLAVAGNNGIRWVMPANFHLTLFHFGLTPAPLLGRIKALLQAAVAETPSFQLTFGDLGGFPAATKKPPKVLYLAPSPPTAALHTLQAKIDRAVAELDFHADFTEWQPHITLGRHNGTTRTNGWWQAMQQLALNRPAPVTVEEVTFFQSLPQPGGTTYAKLAAMPLLH